ncbi:MAG: tetratricopeptide repeat protein, partial [Chitinophagaceae bacterium]
MKKYTTIFIAVLLLSAKLQAQSTPESDRTIQKGNEFYKLKQYDKAEAAYKEVIDKEKLNTTATFNRANAFYRQSKTDDAMKALDDVIMNADNAELKGKAYYNKGAILSAQKNLEESIEAYKSALRQYPDDKEARENLQKALTELKKKNPPPPPKEDKKKQQKKQQQQPKMDKKEAEQRLKLLEQKEKEVQQRLQN